MWKSPKGIVGTLTKSILTAKFAMMIMRPLFTLCPWSSLITLIPIQQLIRQLTTLLIHHPLTMKMLFIHPHTQWSILLKLCFTILDTMIM